LEERQNIDSFDNDLLIKAEIDIDNIIANFYQGAFSKQFKGFETFESTKVVLTTTTATISDITVSNGYYAYTTLEILSGSNSGVKLAVKNNTNNVLTFFNTNTGITGSETIKIYQTGKAPFYCDTNYLENTYFKSIDARIKDAVAFQYVFREKNKDLDQNKATTGYRVSQDEYSENFDTSIKNSITDRISPQALDILQSLTSQTI
jgi:hypothetical protein